MKAIITGASRGMGKRYAYELATRGYNLTLIARSMNKLMDIKEDIEKKYNIQVRCIQADLSIEDEIQKLNEGFKLGKNIDIFINNAGFGFFGDFIDQDPNKLEQMLNLNMKALTLFTHTVNKMMARNKKGIIINISSVANFIHPFPASATYAATKTYVDSFSRAINYENKKLHNNVRVVSVRPGLVKTNFYNAASKAHEQKSMKGFTNATKFVAKTMTQIFNGKDVITIGKYSHALKYFAKFVPRKIFYKFGSDKS